MDLAVVLDAQRAVHIDTARDAAVHRAATLKSHGPVAQGVCRLVFIQKGAKPRAANSLHRADAFPRAARQPGRRVQAAPARQRASTGRRGWLPMAPMRRAQRRPQRHVERQCRSPPAPGLLIRCASRSGCRRACLARRTRSLGHLSCTPCDASRAARAGHATPMARLSAPSCAAMPSKLQRPGQADGATGRRQPAAAATAASGALVLRSEEIELAGRWRAALEQQRIGGAGCAQAVTLAQHRAQLMAAAMRCTPAASSGLAGMSESVASCVTASTSRAQCAQFLDGLPDGAAGHAELRGQLLHRKRSAARAARCACAASRLQQLTWQVASAAVPVLNRHFGQHAAHAAAAKALDGGHRRATSGRQPASRSIARCCVVRRLAAALADITRWRLPRAVAALPACCRRRPCSCASSGAAAPSCAEPRSRAQQCVTLRCRHPCQAQRRRCVRRSTAARWCDKRACHRAWRHRTGKVRSPSAVAHSRTSDSSVRGERQA